MPYLIDGNNLMGSWGGTRPAGDRRAEVVRRVASFCRVRGARATLVFDGAPLRGDVASQQLGSVCLRFPRPGQDADSVIKDLVEKAPRRAELIVVSSDKALYSYVKTLGAKVLRAHEWNALERRRPRGPEGEASEKPDREEDVEGWLERFGG